MRAQQCRNIQLQVAALPRQRRPQLTHLSVGNADGALLAMPRCKLVAHLWDADGAYLKEGVGLPNKLFLKGMGCGMR